MKLEPTKSKVEFLHLDKRIKFKMLIGSKVISVYLVENNYDCT